MSPVSGLAGSRQVRWRSGARRLRSRRLACSSSVWAPPAWDGRRSRSNGYDAAARAHARIFGCLLRPSRRPLETQARRIIGKQKNEILNGIAQLISVQRDNITALESRLKTGDLKAHQDQIKLLRDLEIECNRTEQIVVDPKVWPPLQSRDET